MIKWVNSSCFLVFYSLVGWPSHSKTEAYAQAGAGIKTMQTEILFKSKQSKFYMSTVLTAKTVDLSFV